MENTGGVPENPAAEVVLAIITEESEDSQPDHHHLSKSSKCQQEELAGDRKPGSLVGGGGEPIKDPAAGDQQQQTRHLAAARSPEITRSSPHKPPRIPQQDAAGSNNLVRRRSIPSSAFSKPKSRFAEQTLPAAAAAPSTPAGGAAASPFRGSPKAASSVVDEDDDDDEIYRKDIIFESKKMKKKRNRIKARILIEWVVLVAAVGCMIASIAVRRLQGIGFWGLELWKWSLMVAVICSGRLLSQWLVTLVVFTIEKNFLLKNKVLYFVYGLKNSVQVCVWLGLVLLSWSLLFDPAEENSASTKTKKALSYVTRALVSLLVASLIWLAKTLLVKILASSFHMNRFFDRIQESIFHQYVLQMLSGPPTMELAEKVGKSPSTGRLSFRNVGEGKQQGKEEEGGGVVDVSRLHKMRQEKISAWTMKGLVNVIKSSGLTTISNTIDETFDEDLEPRDKEITSEWEAKAAAHEVFKNVAKPNSKYIDEEDLLRFLTKEEVELVLPLFQGAAVTRRIKKSSLKRWVVKAYMDRKSLAHSLNDTKTAVNQLHKLATAVVAVVIVVITLLLMGVATTKVLLLLSSQLLLVAFMFGNTCKTAFEALVFVFVMHPFDVGDRCSVDGVQMIVEEMNILTTVFLRFDNEKIYYPNSVLATKPISNFYRSPAMSDSMEFCIDVATPIECIVALKSKIKSFIESKANHWQPSHSVVVKEIVEMNKMNMALYVKHTINYQNVTEKNARRTELLLELKRIFEELSIKYRLLPQEVHVVRYADDAPPPQQPFPAAAGGRRF